TQRQLAEMDRNGTLARFASPAINWAARAKPVRALMERVAHIDRTAELPKFHTRTFVSAAKGDPIAANAAAPAFGKRKAALYAGCFGMPFLEQAELDRVAANAAKVSRELVKLIDEGYDIVALTASCGLMLKFEWPLIVPENEDVKRVADATFDIDEYVVDIAKKEGLPTGMAALPEGVTVHLACHARAQNMGPKAAEMLRLIPGTPVDVIERCSGHGGTFGVVKPTHDLAVKVGLPVFRTANSQGRGHIVSDCPLAAQHIVQNVKELAARDGGEAKARETEHPIQIVARAYGLV